MHFHGYGLRIAWEGEYIVIDHGYTRTGKQLAEAKAEEKRKELQTLTENLISKYQGKLTGVTRKKTDQRTPQLCFMKSSGLQAIR
jgi:hypothetical protein